MILLLIISTIAYLILLVMLRIGLSRLHKPASTSTPSVSILIAARNEAQNIAPCLESLLAQDYPKDKYEIIVIDDDSTDGTAAIVKRYQGTDQRIKLIDAGENPENLGPKKNAIRWGIQASKSDILITTDADCTPPKNWLSTITSYFEKNVGVVAGPSALAGKGGWLKGWLELENLGNIAIYAGSTGLGFPVGAQGANLSYRRKVWDSLGYGDEGKTFSGDDDLFVQRVARDGTWKVRYALEPSANVPHHHHVTGTGTVRQKRRHLSAVRWYRPEIVILAALIALYHALLAIGLIVGLFIFPVFITWLLCLIAKTIGDGLILHNTAHRLNIIIPWHWLPIAELLRPWAAIFLIPISLFGRITWKDRTRTASPIATPGETS